MLHFTANALVHAFYDPVTAEKMDTGQHETGSFGVIFPVQGSGWVLECDAFSVCAGT